MKSDDFLLKDQEVTCPSPVPLVKGKTYYIVARSAGTKYRMSQLWRFTEGTNVVLQRPSCIVNGFTGRENTGSGWRKMGGGEGVDAPLFVGF